MPKQISIRRKILLTFGIFVLISIGITVYGYHKYHLLNQKIHLVERKTILLNFILEARRYEKNFFITFQEDHLKSALSYADKTKEGLTYLINRHGEYAQAKDLDQQLDVLKKYENSLESLFQVCQKLTYIPSKVSDIPEGVEHFNKIRKLGRNFTEALETGLKKERQYTTQIIKESRWYLFIFLGMIVFIAIVTFFFLIINVDKPLKSIERAIHKISKGDYKNIPEIKTGDEFEHLVVSLNHMLNELNYRSEQLVRNEKMAALGTLTSGVAHELNNPLNNISTSLQIIQEELGEEDIDYQRELITESVKEVSRTQDIVKALLEYSRETEFTLSWEHFKTLVNNTIKLIQGEIPSGISLNVEVPDNIYSYVDPRRIQQVLLNLSINAVQAIDNKEGQVTIKAFEAKDHDGFYFQVQDTGKGISPEVVSKIFDPFYTEKDVGKGSGLGLSVSKGIVENHGGRIDVESYPGQGTTFTVFLPHEPKI